MSGERPDLCAECGSPLDARQRYCLTCGTRTGGPSPQLTELLRRIGDADVDVRPVPGGSEEDASTPTDAGAGDRARARSATNGLRIPSPRVSALLVLVFLGFGVLLGSAAGS